MASMRDIKRRKSSISSTQQITKAMKLVSTVKLQKTKTRAENAKPYFDEMYAVITSVLAKSGNIDHPYLKSGSSEKKAVIVVTSNRGLAGGYNSNVVKLITAGELEKNKLEIYAIGKKGREALEKKGYEIKEDYSSVINSPLYQDAKEISAKVLEEFTDGKIGEIYLAYTSFKNTVVHIPKLLKLLPVEIDLSKVSREEALTPMNYEMEEEEALEIIIPKYVTSIIYGALIEAVASENGARMQAMDSATSNAEEMIDKLSLQYNRARQGSITQELTEIIAGAQAVD
ncbi:MAG: ATP synthase F1 subunit gamma [Lachnospiraceae bacterium]|nr:ATP synthase F1 subunit gamma [Robinsoniella sp.]MDY3765577.1 ATP synthase F1 subunit gamma [Lachnospiraceae bacterium]